MLGAGDNNSSAGGAQRASASAAAIQAVSAVGRLAGHHEGVGHGQRAVRADHAAGSQGTHHGDPAMGGKQPTGVLLGCVLHPPP